MMTRANLFDLAQRIGLYADQPDLSVGEIIGDMRNRIEFIGFEPDPTDPAGHAGRDRSSASPSRRRRRSSPPRAPTSSCP